eukprot:6181105-Prymnesium_polylepis.1
MGRRGEGEKVVRVREGGRGRGGEGPWGTLISVGLASQPLTPTPTLIGAGLAKDKASIHVGMEKVQSYEE